jgi:hypothetical protein
VPKDPGYRQPANRKHLVNDQGNIDPARVMWLEMGRFNLVCYDRSKSTVQTTQEKIGYSIAIKVPNKKMVVSLPLASFTKEEILALKQFWDAVLEDSIQFAEQLDKEAEEARQEGHDDIWRLYRTLPNFVDRRRKESEYDPSISSRSFGVDGVDGEPGTD